MIRALAAAGAIAAAFSVGGAGAQAPASSTPAPAQPPPSIREFDLPTVERLGREIARQDRAAWLATDALKPKLPDPKAAGLVGWIVSPLASGGGPDLVRFLRGDADAPEAGYDVRVPASGAPQLSEPADRRLSPDELAMWRARRTATTHMGPVCRPGYNTAVARDPGGRDWLVWLLAPQPAAGTVPFGGHYRFTISPDGTTVKARDALFASCLVTDPRRGVPVGATPVAAVASHVVSGAPVETHVFLQLQAKLPFVIVTPSSGKAWMIENGRIRETKPPSRPG